MVVRDFTVVIVSLLERAYAFKAAVSRIGSSRERHEATIRGGSIADSFSKASVNFTSCFARAVPSLNS